MRLLLLHLGLIGSSHAYARYVEDMQNQSDEVGGIFLIFVAVGFVYVFSEFKKGQQRGMVALGVSFAAIGLVYIFPILGAIAGLIFVIGMIYFMFSNS